jgi:hypothetical protein
MVLRLISCSPRRSGFFVTVASGLRLCPPGRARKTSADLTPASRRQDHTTSPSANNISRLRRFIAHRSCNPPCDFTVRSTLPRPPHPVPTFLTIAKRPSCGTGWVGYRSDWADLEGKYFCKGGLDRANQLDPAWEFSFYARRRGAQKLRKNCPTGKSVW